MTHPLFISDLDGVLLNMEEAWAAFVKEKYGILINQNAITHWELDEALGDVDPVELLDFTWTYPLSPTKGAKKFLRDLSYYALDVVVMTARKGETARGAALRDIEANFKGQIVDVVFTDAAQGKPELLKKIISSERVVGFVDDKWSTAKDVAKLELFDTFLLDKPYNQCLDINVKYKRVFSLSDIVTEVEVAFFPEWGV